MKKYMTMEEFFKTQTTKNDKKKRKNIFDHLIVIGCFCIIIFSLYTIFNWLKDNSKIKQLNKEIYENLNITNSYEDGDLVNPPNDKSSNYYYYVKFPFMEVDFSSLIEQNNDTVAFINIKNTNVNYPVVQTKDNIYYLNHSFDKKSNQAGWIFMDFRNKMDDLNDNTVIYGHARLDRTMFGSLRNMFTSVWQKDKDNYVIYLATPKESMIFQIFSIYTIQKESYYMKTDFGSDDEKQEWLDTMKERDEAEIDTDVDINDKILTLSTCKNNRGGRIVVQAKLIKRRMK